MSSLSATVRSFPVAFALASLLAISCGAVAIWQSGGGLHLILINFIGWLIGLIIALIGARVFKSVSSGVSLLVIALAGVAAAFLHSGLSGVHRWVAIGPLHINIAALVLPIFIATIAMSTLPHKVITVMWVTMIVLLVAQPDASQVTALALSGLFIFANWPVHWRIGLWITSLGLATFSWFRPDPLLPVPEVEGIFSLMQNVSPFLTVAGSVLLAATIFSFFKRVTDWKSSTPSWAVTAYCMSITLLPVVGHFPVPLIGAGMSFPLGWWLGFAALQHARSP